MTEFRQTGVIVIGDEILAGKRKDRHLDYIIQSIQPRGMEVSWCQFVADDVERLSNTLRNSRSDGIPVFCFGGIGATPDDLTRQAAANAFDVPLVKHPQAASLIENRFKQAAFPDRIKMAELPKGADLIPNPYNQVPGFSIGEYHFFPGFPEMARPMVDWVLNEYYPPFGDQFTQRSVRVLGVSESELIPIMLELGQKFSEIKMFSLPRIGEHRWVELGFRGHGDMVKLAFTEMVEHLSQQDISFEIED